VAHLVDQTRGLLLVLLVCVVVVVLVVVVFLLRHVMQDIRVLLLLPLSDVELLDDEVLRLESVERVLRRRVDSWRGAGAGRSDRKVGQSGRGRGCRHVGSG
jgi:hypothetical protein